MRKERVRNGSRTLFFFFFLHCIDAKNVFSEFATHPGERADRRCGGKSLGQTTVEVYTRLGRERNVILKKNKTPHFVPPKIIIYGYMRQF